MFDFGNADHDLDLVHCDIVLGPHRTFEFLELLLAVVAFVNADHVAPGFETPAHFDDAFVQTRLVLFDRSLVAENVGLGFAAGGVVDDRFPNRVRLHALHVHVAPQVFIQVFSEIGFSEPRETNESHKYLAVGVFVSRLGNCLLLPIKNS